MPEYYNHFFDAEATLRQYEKRHLTAQGYDKWMIGRRIGDFRELVRLQKANIHGIAAGGGNNIVYCSCGLTIPDAPSWEAPTVDRLQAVGHWDHTSGQVAHTYRVANELICSSCRHREDLSLAEDTVSQQQAFADAHQTCQPDTN
jgi:hypothetical protein